MEASHWQRLQSLAGLLYQCRWRSSSSVVGIGVLTILIRLGLAGRGLLVVMVVMLLFPPLLEEEFAVVVKVEKMKPSKR